MSNPNPNPSKNVIYLRPVAGKSPYDFFRELIREFNGAAAGIRSLLNPWMTPLIELIREFDKRVARIADLETQNATLRQELEAARAELGIDPLTSLPNKVHFIRALGDRLVHSLRNQVSKTAIIYLDIDGFKGVNDAMGHAAGDQVLIDVAKALRGALKRQSDLVVRLHGDEFAVMVVSDNPNDTINIDHIIGLLRSAVEDLDVVSNSGVKYPVSISAGAFHFDEKTIKGKFSQLDYGVIVAEIMGEADKAMFLDKWGPVGKQGEGRPSENPKAPKFHRLDRLERQIASQGPSHGPPHGPPHGLHI